LAFLVVIPSAASESASSRSSFELPLQQLAWPVSARAKNGKNNSSTITTKIHAEKEHHRE
jgi:hypothetical protein